MEAFDAPNSDAACVRRSRSNTPLQALTTLNEPLFVECAQALALRTVRQGGKSDKQRLTYAFRRCLARAPVPKEESILLGLLAKQTDRYRDGKRTMADPDIYKLVGSPAPRDLPPETLQERMVLAMLNEAAMTLQDGVVREPAEVRRQD